MSILALKGTVENGQIRLAGGVHLPEKTRVLIVVPVMHVLRNAIQWNWTASRAKPATRVRLIEMGRL